MKIMTSVKFAQVSQGFAWIMIGILCMGMVVVYVSPPLIQLFHTVEATGIFLATPAPPLGPLPELPSNSYFPPQHGID